MNVKMRIYTTLGVDGYELCHPVNKKDFERINIEVAGMPRRSKWRPIPMRLIHNNEELELAQSDSPWLGSHALLFKTRAVDLMGSVLSDHGEVLPMECSEMDIWVYNPFLLVDALDEAASSVFRFNDGKIMMIRQYKFRPDIICDIDAFKIPNLRVSPVFVSQRFVDRWNEHGLQGLEFKQVWAPLS